ncbi:MAG: hypothetical protein ABIJ26_05005, partial [Candidatus Margulisiibacteriota bacterium]
TSTYKGNEPFVTYEDKNYLITTAMFQYQTFIVISLSIKNKTQNTIGADQYSVDLYDGRDFLPIMKILREDIVAFRGKVEAPTSLGVPDPAIEAALSTVVSLVKPKSQSELVKGLNRIIDSYYAFRPIYPGETRDGFISYLVAFKLEYPVTMVVKIKDKKIAIPFNPEQTQ